MADEQLLQVSNQGRTLTRLTKRTAVLIDGFEIDAAISEEHAFAAEVTAHPVEKGADVADHIRPQPVVVSIEGVVSDTPMLGLADRRGDRDSSGRFQYLPSNDALAWLKAIRDRAEPITIETSIGLYENMLMESLSIPQTAAGGGALRFRASFKQLRVVTNERVQVRVELPKAAKKVNRGTKPATPVPEAKQPAKAKGRRSALKQIMSGEAPTTFFGIGE